MEHGFISEDDYPVRNIDDPVRLSNESVMVTKKLFNKGMWRTDPTPRETLWETTGSTSSARKPSPFQFEMCEIRDRTKQFENSTSCFDRKSTFSRKASVQDFFHKKELNLSLGKEVRHGCGKQAPQPPSTGAIHGRFRQDHQDLRQDSGKHIGLHQRTSSMEVRHTRWQIDAPNPTEDSSHSNLRPAWVLKMSKGELTMAEQTVLSKGPKFAITPSLKAIGFAAPLEAGLKLAEIPDHDQKKEVIRIRVSDVIKRSRQPAANFSTDERKLSRNSKPTRRYTPFRRPSCQAREEKRKFSPTATSLRRRRR